MSKEETPITFKQFKERGELCEFCGEPTTIASRDKHKRGVICSCDWLDKKAEQYAQAKVEELQKENDIAEDQIQKLDLELQQAYNQITQLQKKIELYEKAIEDIENNFCSNDVGHLLDKLKESLTNKKEG